MKKISERTKLQERISKKYPDKLEENLKEMCPRCRWREGDSCYPGLIPVNEDGSKCLYFEEGK